MTKALFRGLFVVTLLLGANALADEFVIGYVKTVQGQASVVTAGRSVQAEPGQALNLAMVLKTGGNGSMGVTLKDDTLLSIGPDTELVLDEFIYAPAQGQLRLVARMVRGSLNYVSGWIAKLKPDAVVVGTPTGNIGVRGTHFVVAVNQD